MQIGMTLPTMVDRYDRSTTLTWCEGIDAGPFASVAVGERITFHNQEQLVLLAAAAALTARVRVLATVVVLPAHPPALMAKQLATIDVLSGGRLSVGVGVGGREHDYRAAGAPFERRFARLDEGVAAMRRVWSGQPPFEGAEPVGPAPAQAGGPPIWSSAMGPRSLARSARWADGLAGFTVGADRAELAATAAQVRAAWDVAGREQPPHLLTTAWVSLGPGAAERHRAYVHRYLAIDPGLADLLTDAATVVGEDALARALDAAEAAGFDEFVIVPTTADPAELDRMAAVVAAR